MSPVLYLSRRNTYRQRYVVYFTKTMRGMEVVEFTHFFIFY